MIYRFRIILDAQEDVFRDIEIEAKATLEDFHNTIIQSFGFAGQEMASFYLSNEIWKQGEEIVLYNMNEGNDSLRVMNETFIDEVTDKSQTKLIYVYDFLNMWTFLIELADIAESEEEQSYPNLMFAVGDIPEVSPKKEFIAEDSEEDDYSGLYPNEYDDIDFNENLN